MPIIPYIIRFWKPIASAIGGAIGWEAVDEFFESGETNPFIVGLAVVSTIIVLAVAALYFLGYLTIGKKKRRRK
jgi:hypothetical protein